MQQPSFCHKQPATVCYEMLAAYFTHIHFETTYFTGTIYNIYIKKIISNKWLQVHPANMMRIEQELYSHSTTSQLFNGIAAKHKQEICLKLS